LSHLKINTTNPVNKKKKITLLDLMAQHKNMTHILNYFLEEALREDLKKTKTPPFSRTADKVHTQLINSTITALKHNNFDGALLILGNIHIQKLVGPQGGFYLIMEQISEEIKNLEEKEKNKIFLPPTNKYIKFFKRLLSKIKKQNSHVDPRVLLYAFAHLTHKTVIEALITYNIINPNDIDTTHAGYPHLFTGKQTLLSIILGLTPPDKDIRAYKLTIAKIAIDNGTNINEPVEITLRKPNSTIWGFQTTEKGNIKDWIKDSQRSPSKYLIIDTPANQEIIQFILNSNPPTKTKNRNEIPSPPQNFFSRCFGY
jgi:hypothetical protein